MACCDAAAGNGSKKMSGEECHDCKGWEAEIYWKRFKPLHFFQIVNSHQELAMPKKFADNVKSVLPRRVTLRGPSGASWAVGLTMRDDGLFFRDGWEEFAKAYSLQEKNILFFKYDVNSCFDVLIFDEENLCEIESTYFIKKCQHLIPAMESPRKRIASEANLEEDPGDVCVPPTNDKKSTEDVGGSPVAETTQHGLQNIRRATTMRRRKTLACKTVFSKTNPRKEFHFRSSKKSRVPSVAAAENGNSPDKNNTFNNEEFSPGDQGKPMDVDSSIPCTASADIFTSSRGRPRKMLKSLKLVNATEIKGSSPNKTSSKKVSWAKAGLGSGTNPSVSDDPKQVGGNVQELDNQKAIMMANDKLTDDSFIAVMRPTCVSKRFVLTVPQAWCSKHLSPCTQDLVLGVGEKTWTVRISQSTGRSTGQIYTGWKAFALDNQLQERDVCLFKIVKPNQNQGGETVVLDVSIFRADVAAATTSAAAADDTGTVAVPAPAPGPADEGLSVSM